MIYLLYINLYIYIYIYYIFIYKFIYITSISYKNFNFHQYICYMIYYYINMEKKKIGKQERKKRKN